MYTHAMDTRGKDRDDAPRAARSAEEAALRNRIKTLIGISTSVNVGAPDSLERTLVGKAKRVVDKRKAGVEMRA